MYLYQLILIAIFEILKNLGQNLIGKQSFYEAKKGRQEFEYVCVDSGFQNPLTHTNFTCLWTSANKSLRTSVSCT